MKELIISMIKSIIYPDPILILGLMLIIIVDLFTGVRKAKKRGRATSSRGFRDTIDKAKNYCSLICTVLILINIASLSKSTVEYHGAFNISINGLMIGCIYIEAKSIFENLIAINTNKLGIQNEFCTSILVPLHNLLIFKFSKKLTDKPLN